MAKGKKKKTKVKPSSEGWRRVKTFLMSEDFRKVRGVFWVLASVFALAAILTFFFNGQPDYREAYRDCWLGWLGGALGCFFPKFTFGLGSLGFCLLSFLYGMRLLNKNILPWWKTFFCTCFWMAWISSVMGFFNLPENHNMGNFAGAFGDMVAHGLNQVIKAGFPILLIFLAGAFLILVHHVKFPEIKLPERKENVENEEEDNGVDEKRRPGLLQRLIVGYETNEEEEKELETDIKETSPLHRFGKKHKKQQEEPIAEPIAATQLSDIPFSVKGDDEPEEEASTPKPEPSKQENEVTTFDIDDEFARINQRARVEGKTNDPTFTVVETEPMAESQSPTTEEPQEEDQDEELPPDDYRRYYGTDGEPYDPKLDLKDFQMPGTDILEDWEKRNVKVTKEELIANKDRIVDTLRNYGIEIVEISASPGPTVTLYEIKPAPGVRISKIKVLEDDIALSLSALGIRIIAPIPGKGTVGIEVPNANPQIVSMKTMLTSDAFVNNTKYELPIAFGKTISNDPFVTDLAKMPHLLMAGATGTGKSVGLNAVIASLLYKKHPAELKFVMVDPKKVELSLYNKIERHYLAKLPDSDEAVITDVKKVVRTLNSLCIEMDQRYDLLKQAQVRKIKEYNEKFINRQLNPNNGHRFLPYIVLVIDEFADLIMTAGKEIEAPICRLAQLARAVGIHLIIATQRPTTNIITGTIKANFPARVAFKVTSAIDSKTILDVSGAQRLIGRGDMLISLSGNDLIRIQCALMETEECDRLADFIGQQHGYAEGEGFQLPEYLDENEEPNKDFDPKQKDEFFNDAARLVVSSQFGSTSLLQRKLQLGYNRAGRIIDQLEAAGIVGPYNGSKAREVLIKDEVALEEILREL